VSNPAARERLYPRHFKLEGDSMQLKLAICGVVLLASASMSGRASAQADWTQQHPTTSPPARTFTAMAQLGDKAVMFGGGGVSQTLGDTWIWNGTNWSQITHFGIFGNGPQPQARTNASMAFDPDTGQAVLFGGVAGSQTLGDTWTLTFNQPSRLAPAGFFEWTQLSLPVSPPARGSASMEYEPISKTVILTMGSSTTGGNFQDTWSFAPATSAGPASWTQLAISQPTPRNGAAMAKCGQSFDCSIVNGRESCSIVADPNQLLLFGGFNGARLGDTWDLRRTAGFLDWSGPLTLQFSPPARFLHAMAYYPVAAQIVLYGGSGNNFLLNDTWNGACFQNTTPSWAQAVPAHNPGFRDSHAMTTGPSGLSVVLFGGILATSTSSQKSNETWTWGRQIACLPDSGSQISAGSSVQCLFTAGDGVRFEGWKTHGFESESRRESTIAFQAKEHGPASITARWTDAAGKHEETLEYDVTRRKDGR
jgi:hypothetical protein